MFNWVILDDETILHFLGYMLSARLYNVTLSVSQQSNKNETLDMKIRMISTLLNLEFLVQTTLVYGTPCIVTGKLVSISVKWSVRKQLSTPLTRCSHQIPYRVAYLVHHNNTGYFKQYIQ